MKHSIHVRTGLVGASLFALALGAAPALAQDEPAPPATQDSASEDGDGETLIVTGSRIPRANFDTAQPTVLMSSEQLDQRGYTNLADALEELPAFGVPGSSPVGAGQGGELGSGQNFVNFFGLGDQRTLTVVNARRFVSSNTASIFGPTGNGGQVDFNVLPTLLIDRVETIAVGGSPIYGSDAIAGTINVITKRNFTGLTLDAQGSISQRGDAHDYRLRGAWGMDFAEGRGNFAVSAEYNHTGGLDYLSRPSLNLNSFFTTPLDPASPFANTYIRDRRLPSISEQGIPQVSDAFFVVDPVTAANLGPAFGLPFAAQVGVTNNGTVNGAPLVFNNAGELVPIDFGQRTGNLLNYDGGSGFELPGNLLAPTERYLATALGQYQLTDNIRFFGEAWYAHSKGTNFRDQPEYNSYLFGVAGEPGGQFIISLDNPFLSPQARALIANSLANNPLADAPDQFYLTRANTDLISGRASSTVELYRFVAGIDGNFEAFGRDMTFELVGNYGRSETNGQGRAIVQQNLENALDSVLINGVISCRPGTVNAPVATISSTCAPLNPFGRNISQAARDYVTAITDPRAVNKQWVVTGSIGGSLFDVWGGAVGFALGYEHRHESTNFDPGTFYRGAPDPNPLVDENGDGDPTNDRVSFGQSAVFDPVTGSFDTNEFFAELKVPLISEAQDIPFIRSLELNGAFRWIDHSLAGADPTYTLGATWSPIKDITFRGNYTRSVRSPAITEYFNPTSPIFLTANDPCDANFIANGQNPATRAANCAADGLLPGFQSNIVDFTAQGSLSGNPNLVNEKADAWTVGVVLRPSFIPRLTIAADWVDITVNDAVEALTGTNVLEACYDSPDFPNSLSASGTNFCSLFDRNAAGQVTFVRTGFDNAAQRRFSGLIAELAYQLPTDFIDAGSSLNFGVNYLYNHRLSLQVGTSDLTTLRGSIGYSKHQFTANTTFKNDNLSWQVQAQYFSPALNDPDAPADTYDFPKVKSLVLFNTSVVFRINDSFKFNLVVDNVFDTKQPFPVPAGGGSVTYFDAIRGRYFRAGASFHF